MDEPTRKILVVDDEPRNIRIIEGFLIPQGYSLFSVANGPNALKQVEADPPDLILLDVMMPGMSGFDVCKELKARSETRFIPIVLVTALSDRSAKTAGMEAGADDFISKPVDPVELRARVKSLLRVKTLYDALEARYLELQKLEAMRESLTQMIVHDLKNPLQAVMGHLELMELKGYVSSEPDARQHIRKIHLNNQTLLDMIASILDLAKLEADERYLNLEPVDLREVLEEVELGMDALLEQRELTIRLQAEETLPRVRADREILRRILVNIIGNAITFSPFRGRITVTAASGAADITVSIQDEGPGIPPEYQAHIFEKFGQVTSRREGKKYATGLGLAFCKMAVEAHGGQIGVTSEIDRGSTFWFTLSNN